MKPEAHISSQNIAFVTILLISLALIYCFFIPQFRTLTQRAYTRGYSDGQYELKNELSNTKKEVEVFRRELQGMKEMVDERLKTSERYRAEMGIKQSAFLMSIEDWFDLRRAEMKDLRAEQIQALEMLKEGNVGEKIEEVLEDDKPVGDEKREAEEANKLVDEKIESRRGSSWAKLRVTKKQKRTESRHTEG